MSYNQIAQINLLFQIVILVVVLSGLVLKKFRKLLLHGRMMFLGAILNLISFLTVMGPSLLSLGVSGTEQFSERSVIVLAHASTGSVALVVACLVTVRWRLKSSIDDCVKRKPVMRLVAVLWPVALVLGVLLYMILYLF